MSKSRHTICTGGCIKQSQLACQDTSKSMSNLTGAKRCPPCKINRCTKKGLRVEVKICGKRITETGLRETTVASATDVVMVAIEAATIEVKAAIEEAEAAMVTISETEAAVVEVVMTETAAEMTSEEAAAAEGAAMAEGTTLMKTLGVEPAGAEVAQLVVTIGLHGDKKRMLGTNQANHPLLGVMMTRARQKTRKTMERGSEDHQRIGTKRSHLALQQRSQMKTHGVQPRKARRKMT